jgi:uncharacterized CHY-type Zn-finger protein
MITTSDRKEFGESDGSGGPQPNVHGVMADRHTRCAHYHGDLDVIAIKVRCCGEFYSCKECHDALAGHALVPWSKDEAAEKAILCGKCGALLSISEYLQCGYRCPRCDVGFNPRCALHHHFYFSAS